jgi:hypothetical protein
MMKTMEGTSHPAAGTKILEGLVNFESRSQNMAAHIDSCLFKLNNPLCDRMKRTGNLHQALMLAKLALKYSIFFRYISRADRQRRNQRGAKRSGLNSCPEVYRQEKK